MHHGKPVLNGLRLNQDRIYPDYYTVSKAMMEHLPVCALSVDATVVLRTFGAGGKIYTPYPVDIFIKRIADNRIRVTFAELDEAIDDTSEEYAQKIHLRFLDVMAIVSPTRPQGAGCELVDWVECQTIITANYFGIVMNLIEIVMSRAAQYRREYMNARYEPDHASVASKRTGAARFKAKPSAPSFSH